MIPDVSPPMPAARAELGVKPDASAAAAGVPEAAAAGDPPQAPANPAVFSAILDLELGAAEAPDTAKIPDNPAGAPTLSGSTAANPTLHDDAADGEGLPPAAPAHPLVAASLPSPAAPGAPTVPGAAAAAAPARHSQAPAAPAGPAGPAPEPAADAAKAPQMRATVEQAGPDPASPGAGRDAPLRAPRATEPLAGGATPGPAESLRPEAGRERLHEPARAAVDVRSPDFAQTLGERVRWQIGARSQQAEIRLNPPELGSLEIRVRSADGETSILLNASSAHAREALEAALPRLRELLDASGVRLASLDVAGGDAGERSGQGERGGEAAGSETAGGETSPDGEAVHVTAAPPPGGFDQFA